VADTTAPEQRATGMALLNTAFLGGMAAGPALGLFVAGAAGDPRAGFYLSSALFVLAIVLASVLFPPAGAHAAATVSGAGQHARSGYVATFVEAMRTSPTLATLYFVAFVQMFGVGILIPIAAIYAKQIIGLREQAIGVLFLAVTIAVALAGVPGGRLADRIGKPRLITIGMVIGTAGMWLLPFGGGLLGLVVAGVLLGVSYAFVLPAWLALITELAPPGRLGLAVGASETVQGMGVVLGPLLGGLLWDTLGPKAPFIASAIALTAGTVIAARAMRR
jgi:MFS family permease